ncbi:MAG: hypothetical protein V1806_13980 [Pseudomonadota bacterium]
MKVVDLDHYRQGRYQDPVEAVACALVEDFRRLLQGTLCWDDGRLIDLRTALGLLAHHWGASDVPRPASNDLEGLRHVVEVLQEENNYWEDELLDARDKLAALECPLKELDIVKNQDGERGWVFWVEWGPDNYKVCLKECGKSGRPIIKGRFTQLSGPAEVADWRKVGRVSEAQALKLGWEPPEWW